MLLTNLGVNTILYHIITRHKHKDNYSLYRAVTFSKEVESPKKICELIIQFKLEIISLRCSKVTHHLKCPVNIHMQQTNTVSKTWACWVDTMSS